MIYYYRIAGKFGGNYIWRNGLQAAKNKYWRNLNLAMGNRMYKFYYVIVFRTAEVHTWFDCIAKTEVEVMEEFQLESCVRGHHIYKNTWSPLLGEVLSRGFAASRSMLRLT